MEKMKKTVSSLSVLGPGGQVEMASRRPASLDGKREGGWERTPLPRVYIPV